MREKQVAGIARLRRGAVKGMRHIGRSAFARHRENPHMDAEQQSRRNLLVVEDVPTHQFLLRALLKSAGHDVDVVSNGREAVEAHQLQSYDLILMDCYMPEVDGFEATRQIRQRERNLSLERVPIIAFTAEPTDAARKACIDAGMDDFLMKPCGTWKVADLLTRWLPLDAASPMR
jgi:CheY-like chemotaxis protein